MSKLLNVSLTFSELEHRKIHRQYAEFPYVPVKDRALVYSMRPEHVGGGDRKQIDLRSELEDSTTEGHVLK